VKKKEKERKNDRGNLAMGDQNIPSRPSDTKEQDVKDRTCTICFEHASVWLINPCLHWIVCEACFAKVREEHLIQRCPLCRTEADAFVSSQTSETVKIVKTVEDEDDNKTVSAMARAELKGHEDWTPPEPGETDEADSSSEDDEDIESEVDEDLNDLLQ
jgi:hypothetical protein